MISFGLRTRVTGITSGNVLPNTGLHITYLSSVMPSALVTQLEKYSILSTIQKLKSAYRIIKINQKSSIVPSHASLNTMSYSLYIMTSQNKTEILNVCVYTCVASQPT